MSEFALGEGLRGLKPIHNSAANNASKHLPSILFQIKMRREGEAEEPILEALNVPEDLTLVSAKESALIREMRRSKLNRGGFGSSWGNDKKIEVNLWKNPFLLRLLQSIPGVRFGQSAIPVTFSDESAKLILRLTDLEEGAKVGPTLLLRTAENDYSAPIILTDDSVLIPSEDGATIYTLGSIGENYPMLGKLLTEVPRPLLDSYLSLFLSYFDNITPEYHGKFARYLKEAEQPVATLVLEKVAPDQALYLRVTSMVDSLGEAAEMRIPLSRSASIADDHTITVREIHTLDIGEDVEYLALLIAKAAPSRKAGKEVYRDGDFFIIPYEVASPFLFSYLPQLLSRFKLVGSDKLKEYKISPAKPRLNLKLSSGIDFLEGKAEVTIGNETFTLAQILEQVKQNRYVTLSDGNRAIIDDRYLRRLRRLFNPDGKKEQQIKVTIFDLPEIEDLIQEKVSGTFAKRTRQLYEGFNALKTKKLAKLPVNATLRSYQKEGVKWIKYLYDNSLGGCLADDMGLGKTLQTIAVLAQVTPGAEHPAMIVMPRSLLFNWQNEFAKFAPQIKVATYYGTDRNLEETLKAEVILTTYAVVRNDIEQLKELQFGYVVLDESQSIKNVGSQTSQAIAILRADHRLALSGTPMENNLTELYSLFRFLNPGMFGTLEQFNESYTYPIQKFGDKDAMQSLRRRIFPFMLRRLKKDVLTDLPDRIEQTMYVEMSPEQARYYERRRKEYLEDINQTIAREGIQKSQFVMFQALNELRRIASVPESLTDGAIHSPKAEELMEALGNAVENGHKTVVFFNYIAGLELIGSRLKNLGVEFESMTGSTSATARKKIVERFQTDPDCKVLLMTLKVGGVGLNLTAADTVFIFEPWWNKAAEEQAINRLHRIGQKAVVTAYSMITVDTIEEKILKLQEQKKELFDGLISSDSASSKHLSAEDINFILS